MTSVDMLCNWADNEKLATLNHSAVKSFLYWGKEELGWQARTFRNHRQYLKSFFEFCVKRRYIAKNPVDGIERPKPPRTLPRALTREEIQTVLNHTRWYPWRYQFESVRNETMLYFFVFTGLRLQELINLQIADVNLSSEEILVRLGKGQKDRLIPIHPRLMPVIRNYLSERQRIGNRSAYFFTGVQSELTLSGKDIRTVCRKVSQDCGIYFRPHRLRHTFGRLCVEAELDIFTIKEIMGHSDISVTQTYLSISTENLKRSFAATDLI